ncbi:zinc ribbon domain-containing protein [Halomicrococcus sp. NG-SE-24]|uniref:zinc ribbon domain-containing protein n=1 Tax=Halomicrococcus sp. NG-SE-24 TaxID=3436928 RepID=UPI003D988AE9
MPPVEESCSSAGESYSPFRPHGNIYVGEISRITTRHSFLSSVRRGPVAPLIHSVAIGSGPRQTEYPISCSRKPSPTTAHTSRSRTRRTFEIRGRTSGNSTSGRTTNSSRTSRTNPRNSVSKSYVDPENTSKRCCEYGHTSDGNRTERNFFECESCGATANADYNAAKNVRWRFVHRGLTTHGGRATVSSSGSQGQ